MLKKFNYQNYFNLICDNINNDGSKIIKKIDLLKKKIINCQKSKNKVLIFGNGGSSAIASHFATDLTKAAGIRCINFSDSSLITCLSNDFGFQNWVKKAIEYYADNNDILILISSKGMSQNIINAASNKNIKFSLIATFTGFNKNNKVSKIGNLSFWVNSRVYNIVENVHQVWLLSVIDSIIHDKEN
jgi:D-sedoheptulose 7-phosphate isomerase